MGEWVTNYHYVLEYEWKSTLYIFYINKFMGMFFIASPDFISMENTTYEH